MLRAVGYYQDTAFSLGEGSPLEPAFVLHDPAVCRGGLLDSSDAWGVPLQKKNGSEKVGLATGTVMREALAEAGVRLWSAERTRHGAR